ncbi:SPRY-domain-containing protein [Gigaspora margarita]|uniref:SPRY-domain-containing protein n=1 Tax=Gigaspora margarita TaxID=4874 RepID=A0A8H3ZWD3_GIGMA|nr:SPRY-domain-containing protein [Gigaspora margarita]
MDLPTAWNLDDKSTYLNADSSGLRVNYEGLGESDKDVGVIRANNPIPPYCKLFYFEVDIIDEGKNNFIGIGFCEKEVALNRMPGWDDGTLYPCVGLRSQGGSIEVNFGSRKFKFAATTSNDMGDELLKNKE